MSSSANPTSGSCCNAANLMKWYTFRKLDKEEYVAPEARRVLARFDEAASSCSSTGVWKVSESPASLALRPTTNSSRTGIGFSTLPHVQRISDRLSALTLIIPRSKRLGVPSRGSSSRACGARSMARTNWACSNNQADETPRGAMYRFVCALWRMCCAMDAFLLLADRRVSRAIARRPGAGQP